MHLKKNFAQDISYYQFSNEIEIFFNSRLRLFHEIKIFKNKCLSGQAQIATKYHMFKTIHRIEQHCQQNVTV